VGRDSWEWDETLYEGSAPYYAVGRFPYPPGLASALRGELGLDGTGRLIDVGCGPGSLSLLLAPLFAEVVGVDADPGMLAAARSRAADQGVANVDWVLLRAEQLPHGLGSFDVATFAQSFHWMDQPTVARTVRGMLRAGGAWVHVHATTHRGVGGHTGPFPEPPHDRIEALVAEYLGQTRRAGRGTLPHGTATGEEDVMVAAGFAGPSRVDVPGRMLERTADEVVASVFSRSSSAPHLFGERLAEFERELRRMLHAASPLGRFSELSREIELVIWRV
jgi:SAM-dependent methyltransferase